MRSSFRAVGAELQPVLVHADHRHPTHPLAALKQRSKVHRSYSSYYNGFSGSGTRHYTTRNQGGKPTTYNGRNGFAKNTRIGSAIHHSSGRAPFASTLRPNLTGGTLNRTAGGYAFGAGGAGRSARYFSHSPAAPAQVIHSVSQAVRAFAVSGQKAQFDGVNPRTGEKKFKAVSALQDKTTRKVNGLPKTAPGSYVDFNINPTVTVLTPLASAGNRVSFAMQQTLCNDDLLDVLSVDFSRTLKELAVVLNDLKKLSALGDLPITYCKPALRVHFPGCDYATVENLCIELGIQRALITQDEEFVELDGVAAVTSDSALGLQFPLAPITYGKGLDPGDHHHNFYYSSKEDVDLLGQAASRDQIEWQNMVEGTNTAPQKRPFENQAADAVSSAMTVTGSMFDDINDNKGNIVDKYRSSGHLSSPDGFDTLNSSDLDDITIPLPYDEHRYPYQYHQNGGDTISSSKPLDQNISSNIEQVGDYQGFEGIYRFIEQCDSAVRR